ncbi:Protein CHROMATIN REMODELING [Parasponia andersonii]|uniref:Protein CHROMATIN REMODELING n=1 Tax=Parasponia andersonii TaxID=3476 RepID=A0A2P5E0U7_PARAD|nr:Protein CHROMATIN REMODELING [Parasponia andersonii]
MKRVFQEISDDEWENHSFKPSRVLGNKSQNPSPPPPPPPPPPIESFSFRSSSSKLQVSSQSSDDCVEIRENLEDDDVEEVEQVRPVNRGRRFVIDDEESDEELPEVVGVKSTSDEEDEDEIGEEEVVEEDDVVGKALQKCAKISAELRRDLYGSSVTACDRYAEVETSSVRIVTQDDIDAACKSEDSDFQPILKPYQLVGVNFLLLLHRKGIGGAILADEMGLGKTIQAITYLTLLKHLNNDPGPHLIVCPASVLENWERELKKWCPSFSVLQYHGAVRSAYAKELNSLSKAGLPPPFNVLLVCYSLFERHSAQQKDDRKILKRWQWSCVLMDEAHALKDKNSYRWKNLMGVARHANQRLMLTGTPLQNDLHELWSLLEFMLPDLFATEDIDLKKLLNAEDRDLIGRMKSILGPFILRRLKSDVMQQLVPKIQKVEYVEMGKQQEDAYKEAIEEYREASRARLAKSLVNHTHSIFGVLPRRQISNYFVQFRKIANHPLLVRRIYSDEDVVRFARKLHPMGAFGFECTVDKVIAELKSYNDFSIHRLLLYHDINDSKGVLREKHVMRSAKCQALAELLPSLKQAGHRVLIFSQWTSMLDILEWTLDVIGVSYRRLDGSTQVTERQTIVDTFNNETSIFACLLSTRAGGQGLNLTGADTVVIHDMDFNPQIDRQAEDRCHRIGQTKPVTIYRLVTKGTVDENVYEIAKRKLVLDAAVLESGLEMDEEGDTSEKTMGEILSALLLG